MLTDEQRAKIAAYNKARNEMLLKGDPKALMDFHREYRLPVPSSEKVAEIELHKVRTAIVSLPMDVRSQSKRWLLERGYTAYDDGDVPI